MRILRIRSKCCAKQGSHEQYRVTMTEMSFPLGWTKAVERHYRTLHRQLADLVVSQVLIKTKTDRELIIVERIHPDDLACLFQNFI